MAESLVGSIKQALHKMSRANMPGWDSLLDQVLYGYCRHSSTDGKSRFEVPYGFKPRFSEENEASIQPSTKKER